MILLIIFIIPQTVPFVNMEYYTRNPCVFRKSWRFFGGIYGSATDSKKSTVHYTEYRRSLLFRILSFRKKRLQFNYNSQKAIVFLAVIVYNDRCRNQSAVTAWAVLCEMRCIFDEEDYIFMATKKGIVKKTPIKEYANIRKSGIQAITLREDDELIEVKLTNDNKEIFLVTKLGQCIRFKETDVRPTGRSAMGVIGMNLLDEDEVIGMQLDTQGDSLLIVSELGLGKITSFDEFAVQHRGGKGVKCYKINERTGNVIGIKAVDDTREVMLITTEGIIIQIKCKDISKLGRITSGVKLINLDDNVTVATVAKVRKKPVNEDDSDAEGFDEESIDNTDNIDESDTKQTIVQDNSMDELLERAEKDSDK